MTDSWFPELQPFDLGTKSGRHGLWNSADQFSDACFGTLRFGPLSSPVHTDGLATSPIAEVTVLLFAAGPGGSSRGMRPVFIRLIDCDRVAWTRRAEWALIDEDLTLDAEPGHLSLKWTGFDVRSRIAWGYLGSAPNPGQAFELDALMASFTALSEAEVIDIHRLH